MPEQPKPPAPAPESAKPAAAAAKPAPAAPKEPKEPPPANLKVRATEAGFYDNGHRASGDEFLIREADFSESWMEKVEDTPKEGKP